MILALVRPSANALLVSAAKPGRRGLGVGPGGPADVPACWIANALVGNPPGAPALEIAMGGPALQLSHGGDCRLALFGAPMSMRIGSREVFAGRSFLLRANEVLQIGGTPSGMRAYLAVERGLHPLDTGRFAVSAASVRSERGSMGDTSVWLFDESESSSDELRVVDGPQADWFDPDALTSAAWTISTQMNRMGVRLEGTSLVRQQREMLSEMVLPGTVQITNEGLPIVVGIDAQTIGGYPKIAQTIGADIYKIAQLRPGRRLRFVRVDGVDAERLGEVYRNGLRKWSMRLPSE